MNLYLYIIFIIFYTRKLEGLQKDNEDDIFKQKNLASKTVFNFLKAKIDILHNELQTMRIEYKRKVFRIYLIFF